MKKFGSCVSMMAAMALFGCDSKQEAVGSNESAADAPIAARTVINPVYSMSMNYPIRIEFASIGSAKSAPEQAVIRALNVVSQRWISMIDPSAGPVSTIPTGVTIVNSDAPLGAGVSTIRVWVGPGTNPGSYSYGGGSRTTYGAVTINDVVDANGTHLLNDPQYAENVVQAALGNVLGLHQADPTSAAYQARSFRGVYLLPTPGDEDAIRAIYGSTSGSYAPLIRAIISTPATGGINIKYFSSWSSISTGLSLSDRPTLKVIGRVPKEGSAVVSQGVTNRGLFPAHYAAQGKPGFQFLYPGVTYNPEAVVSAMPTGSTATSCPQEAKDAAVAWSLPTSAVPATISGVRIFMQSYDYATQQLYMFWSPSMKMFAYQIGANSSQTCNIPLGYIAK